MRQVGKKALGVSFLHPDAVDHLRRKAVEQERVECERELQSLMQLNNAGGLPDVDALTLLGTDSYTEKLMKTLRVSSMCVYFSPIRTTTQLRAGADQTFKFYAVLSGLHPFRPAAPACMRLF